MVGIHIHDEELTSPIQSLESYFKMGGTTILQAAFAHSFFIHPDEVRRKTPYFRNFARKSREHYPGCGKGDSAKWQTDGREVRLDDNQHAQIAWKKYSGRPLARKSGYGLRHVWGHSWDPDAFTAGWNFCYMPFWAGMLTEDQHPLPELRDAMRQASWDLYFTKNPVCEPPEFVRDPGVDLASVLADRPLLVLKPQRLEKPGKCSVSVSDLDDSIIQHVRDIRAKTHRSWVNIYKAARSLQCKDHESFGTMKVESSAKSVVRRIHYETGLSLLRIETLAGTYNAKINFQYRSVQDCIRTYAANHKSAVFEVHNLAKTRFCLGLIRHYRSRNVLRFLLRIDAAKRRKREVGASVARRPRTALA